MGSATSPPTPRVAELAVTTVRIERSKLDALKAVAGRERRSTSQQIRWLIDRCLEEQEIAA